MIPIDSATIKIVDCVLFILLKILRKFQMEFLRFGICGNRTNISFDLLAIETVETNFSVNYMESVAGSSFNREN